MQHSNRMYPLGRVAALFVALAALAVAGALAVPATAAQSTQHVTIVIKSDTEHGKKGPDGAGTTRTYPLRSR